MSRSNEEATEEEEDLVKLCQKFENTEMKSDGY